MPWNEPGENKPRDPWGSGGKGGDQPPDLDEVFRKLQQRLRGLFGGTQPPGKDGGSGVGVVIALALLGAALWMVADSAHIIEQTERGVVTRFGAYNRTLQPGLRFTLPRPIETVEKVDVTQIRSVSDQGSMLTRDENIVQIEFSVQYRVKNAEQFLFQVRDPEGTLKQAAEAALRHSVGDSDMDYILGSGRAEVGILTKQLIQDLLDTYNTGLEITQFNLKDARPPDAVKAAFDDATRAREDKETYKNEAEAYANTVIPEARGQAERLRQEAEAYKARVVALATGEAERFRLQAEAYAQAPEITRQRLYLDMLEQVLSSSRKVLMDSNQGNSVLYLPLDRLPSGQADSGSAATPRQVPSYNERNRVSPQSHTSGNNDLRRVDRNPNREVER